MLQQFLNVFLQRRPIAVAYICNEVWIWICQRRWWFFWV